MHFLHRCYLEFRTKNGENLNKDSYIIRDQFDITDLEQILKKINEPEFPREYQGLYLGKVGNLFTQNQISEWIQLGQQYKDPGFSSSATGIIVLEHIKPELTEDKIRVIESRLIEKGDPNQIVNLCWDIWERNGYVNTVFWIDGSNRAMVNLLKIRYDERLTWESTQTFGPNTRIRPVNFSTEHRNMLSNLHAMISKGYLEIEEKTR